MSHSTKRKINVTGFSRNTNDLKKYFTCFGEIESFKMTMKEAFFVISFNLKISKKTANFLGVQK